MLSDRDTILTSLSHVGIESVRQDLENWPPLLAKSKQRQIFIFNLYFLNISMSISI